MCRVCCGVGVSKSGCSVAVHFFCFLAFVNECVWWHRQRLDVTTRLYCLHRPELVYFTRLSLRDTRVAHTTRCRARGRARRPSAPGSSGGVALLSLALPVRRRAWVSCPRGEVARTRLCHLLGAVLSASECRLLCRLLRHILCHLLARRARRARRAGRAGRPLVDGRHERGGPPSPRAVVAPRSPPALRCHRHRSGFRPCCERAHLARPALRPCLTVRARLALRPRPALHPRLACGLRDVLSEAQRRATRANLVRVGVGVRVRVTVRLRVRVRVRLRLRVTSGMR